MPRDKRYGVPNGDSSPSYSIQKAKSSVDRDKLPEIYQRLREKFADATVNDMDGLRFDWSDRWLLIRPSNTEPIVRVICEAASEGESSELVRATLEVVGN